MGFFRDRLMSMTNRSRMGAASFLTAIFNTVALLLIARNMGPAILGTLGFLLSFMGLFFFVGDLGNTMAFEKVLARGYRFSDCYRAFMMAKLKLTVYMAVLGGILIALYMFVLEPAGHTPLHPVSMIIILGYFITINLAGIWIVGMDMKRKQPRPRTHELIESLAKTVMIAGVLWLAEVSGDQDAIFQLTFIYLVAGTLSLMLVRNNARRLKGGEPNEEIEVDFQEASGKIVPFMAFSALLLNLDKLALWLFSDFGTLGLYFGAQRITVFIGAAAISIEILLGGVLAAYVRENDVRKLSDTLRLTERYVCLVVLPVALFYIVLSHDLLAAFLGEDFAGAGTTVALLAGAGFFTALASPHISYLLKADRAKDLAISSGIALAVFCVIAGILLPDLVLPDTDIHGTNGTALALLASSLAGYIAVRYVTWKALDCPPHPRMLAHLLSAGIMMAFIQFLVWYFAITLSFAWIVAMAIVGTTVYALSLYLTGEMYKRDFERFRELTRQE
jgi:O-antigen/teichoic acid export membrane protein